MARDADALLLRKWASADGAVVETPEDAGLDRDVGFPASYGVDMARSVGLWNQQRREVTALFVELAEHGVLPWHADQRYEHPAWTTGSDGRLYRSVQASGGASPSQNPATDTSTVYWRPFVLSVQTSTTGRRGTIEQATLAETRAGIDDERSVSPSRASTVIAEAIAAAQM